MRFAAGLLTLSLGAVTVGLTSLVLGTALAAIPLEGIEVVGTRDRLHLLLKSHQLLPARIVSQQPDEVVLELNNIDTRTPIATRFSGQGIVSHVSMQAVGENRMRVVLRGENLPEADIAFNPVSIPQASDMFKYETPAPARKPGLGHTTGSGAKTVQSASSALSTLTQPVKKPAAQKAVHQSDQLTDLMEADTTAAKTPVKSPYATAPKAAAAKGLNPKPLFAELPPEPEVTDGSSNHTDPYEPLLSAINGDPAAESPKPDKTQSANVSATTAEPVALQAQAETAAVKQGLDWIHTYGLSMLGGILMAVAGGALFWMFSKRSTRLAHADNYPLAEEYWDEEPPELPLKVKRQATRPGSQQDVLGLSAFQRDIEPYGRYAADDLPPPRPARSSRPEGIRRYQQEAMGPSSATKSRQNGSAHTATTRLSSQTGRPDAGRQSLESDLTREEIRRSAGVKQRTAEAFQPPRATKATEPDINTRPQPPKPQTAKPRNGVRESLQQLQANKGALPANPEVLDFLKSVADYMDMQASQGTTPPSGASRPRPQR